MVDSFLRLAVSVVIVACFVGLLYAGTLLTGRYFVVFVLVVLIVGRFAYALGLNSGLGLAMRHQRQR